MSISSSSSVLGKHPRTENEQPRKSISLSTVGRVATRMLESCEITREDKIHFLRQLVQKTPPDLMQEAQESSSKPLALRFRSILSFNGPIKLADHTFTPFKVPSSYTLHEALIEEPEIVKILFYRDKMLEPSKLRYQDRARTLLICAFNEYMESIGQPLSRVSSTGTACLTPPSSSFDSFSWHYLLMLSCVILSNQPNGSSKTIKRFTEYLKSKSEIIMLDCSRDFIQDLREMETKWAGISDTAFSIIDRLANEFWESFKKNSKREGKLLPQTAKMLLQEFDLAISFRCFYEQRKGLSDLPATRRLFEESAPVFRMVWALPGNPFVKELETKRRWLEETCPGTWEKEMDSSKLEVSYIS
ncbi:MAG: hypothetical protein JSS61_04245 [Verrucomicrobia bacterium]|nr:hypothetical protein [Verrucomicrobiota bacterium]